jgi:predicted GH43/DUF377 family glycosyl hydrolase
MAVKIKSQRRIISPPVLERFQENPILTPRQEYWWETKASFNPAAIYVGGKVHILYRAIGDTDNSVLGYASSSDGFHIDERLPEPAYIPRKQFEGISPFPYRKTESSGIYISGGGGMGGCEDPRLTRINDTIYLTYVAYSGYSAPRIALTSINLDDFLNKNWKWKEPVLISEPDIVNKNACLLPEKINGKFVIFHRIFPDILIDFVDDLNFDGKTRWLQGHFRIPAKDSSSGWDSRKVAVGPPPIKTKYGWLMIYHAIDNKDEFRYKIGAMLLDINEPTKVLARTKQPVLEPETKYENIGWKSGVVYPCGAVIINERLFVYYGGADMVTCVATAQLDEFISQLEHQRESVQVSVPENPPANVPFTEEEHIQGYCMKCHAKREMKNPLHIMLKNMAYAVQGICPKCGTKMFKFGKN